MLQKVHKQDQEHILHSKVILVLKVLFIRKMITLSCHFRTTKLITKYSWYKVFTATLSYSLDLVKDSLVLAQISLSQGGIENLMSQSQPYMKWVSLVFLT